MSAIMRLPKSLRIYIFGLSGLGSKLLPESEVPWCSISLGSDDLEAEVRYGSNYSTVETAQKYQKSREAAQEQAFRHPLYKVSRQFRVEARCALLKYNVIELTASEESISKYEKWLPEYFASLCEVAVIPCGIAEMERLCQLLKNSSNFNHLRIHIQRGLRYGILWEDWDSLRLKEDGHVEEEETYEEMVPMWLAFQGVQDLFIYYASLFHLETKHEKMVMGEDYDSEARGKLSPDFRDWEVPWCKSDPPDPMVRW
ncbi:MAG: hypothetical protein GOMPHAMPRED_001736 [Gomphillus americanus]|uniref:Uncharacterized protein n=1 Tax=Gomphillus americanus TaxID=1940652 RepID=A0A8H3IL10_9LECA|nr:MAG: hypothetical protein GOMPHAMPRED_001736 [Gomphillus americanus]